MVTMRAQAVDMIYRLPDKEVVAVINFLNNILNGQVVVPKQWN